MESLESKKLKTLIAEMDRIYKIANEEYEKINQLELKTSEDDLRQTYFLSQMESILQLKKELLKTTFTIK